MEKEQKIDLKETIEHKKMNIIKQGKEQYSVRIPRNFVESMEGFYGDIRNANMVFTLKISKDKEKKVSLTAEVVYGL